MTGSKKSHPASPDALAKASSEGTIELSEKALSETSGGSLNFALKFDSAQKVDVNPALLLPAVKPGV